MMAPSEYRGSYSSEIRHLVPNYVSSDFGEALPAAKSVTFAMKWNGYFPGENGDWKHIPAVSTFFGEKFKGEKVALFGPGGADPFFYGNDIGKERYLETFNQKPVVDVITKFRDIDEDQAARIAFLLGGIVRNRTSKGINSYQTANIAGFAARMIGMAEGKSVDAIVHAAAMYAVSGGPIDENPDFFGHTYHMIDAIRTDPITPRTTQELGLSQLARLRTFSDATRARKIRPFPDIDLSVFKDFPTVGAEFHFSPKIIEQSKHFWERLALLNMSQHVPGNYVQKSRNDRDVIEVRMNPSVFPITIANWESMHYVLPELKKAFFTITVNRTGQSFHWNDADRGLLNSLKALGMLTYSGTFESIPRRDGPEEIDFGTVYLGQTVRMNNGKYTFEGNWGGGEGDYGQMGIYAGFGNNLPLLAYYLSMVLAKPDIVRHAQRHLLGGVKTLHDALNVSSSARSQVFDSIQKGIEDDSRLADVYLTALEISDTLAA